MNIVMSTGVNISLRHAVEGTAMNEEKYCGFDIDDYLQAVAEKLGIDSDRQLALRLGVTPGAMSQYKSGARVMDDYCATQIASFLKINPMLVIAAANEKREKHATRKQYWKELQICLTTGGSLMYTAILAIGIMALFFDNSVSYETFAFAPLYIMRNHGLQLAV